VLLTALAESTGIMLVYFSFIVGLGAWSHNYH